MDMYLVLLKFRLSDHWEHPYFTNDFQQAERYAAKFMSLSRTFSEVRIYVLAEATKLDLPGEETEV